MEREGAGDIIIDAIVATMGGVGMVVTIEAMDIIIVLQRMKIKGCKHHLVENENEKEKKEKQHRKRKRKKKWKIQWTPEAREKTLSSP